MNIKKLMALPKVVFVLGPPGSGKGTQCQKIVNKFGYVHLSAGELLRKEMCKEQSNFKNLIEKHMKEGTIVPVEITCNLLEMAMKESMHVDKKMDKFLIDGFPRNENNLNGWTTQMHDKTQLLFVLFFECSEEECINRCLARGESRVDDNLESLKKRIETYHTGTKPIIDHYDKLGIVKKIDSLRSPDQVFSEVESIFKNI